MWSPWTNKRHEHVKSSLGSWRLQKDLYLKINAAEGPCDWFFIKTDWHTQNDPCYYLCAGWERSKVITMYHIVLYHYSKIMTQIFYITHLNFYRNWKKNFIIISNSSINNLEYFFQIQKYWFYLINLSGMKTVWKKKYIDMTLDKPWTIKTDQRQLQAVPRADIRCSAWTQTQTSFFTEKMPQCCFALVFVLFVLLFNSHTCCSQRLLPTFVSADQHTAFNNINKNIYVY